jgi:hypothetical protein
LQRIVARQPVDNTDWLKTSAIILVALDQIGYFFIENDVYWSTLGRLAAPSFFLMGYANTCAVPLRWLWFGGVPTLLESWNANWNGVATTILLRFAFIRCVRTHVQIFVQNFAWVAFTSLVCMLIAVLPARVCGPQVRFKC